MSGLFPEIGVPDYRGVRIIEVSGLERCPDYRGVRIREVSGLERCPD